MEGETQTVLMENLKSIIWLLVPIITSGIVTFLITRYSTRTPVQNNILEKQLIQVFGPIQWIYLFIFPDNPEKSFDMIQEIIRESVAVVPVQLLRRWKIVTQSVKTSDALSAFLDINEAFFEFAQYKLGYTAEVLSREHKSIAKALINSGFNNFNRSFKRSGIFFIFMAVFYLGISVLCILASYNTHSLSLRIGISILIILSLVETGVTLAAGIIDILFYLKH